MAPYLRRFKTDLSDSGSSWDSNDSSSQSQSSAPTSDGLLSQPSLKQHETAMPAITVGSNATRKESTSIWGNDERSSVETYASTVPEEADNIEGDPDYEVPEYHGCDLARPEPLPCTPPEFAQLFPSTRRLCIRHDDSTLDGNMNVRIDTEVNLSPGHRRDFTLYHLRMHDLKTRDFSLRRYCRDSGREVCHTSRKFAKPGLVSRPGLQRSMSSALATIRARHDHAGGSGKGRHLRRQDSGYDSGSDVSEAESGVDTPTSREPVTAPPTNTMKLEFSNYAHVNVTRAGPKMGKRYEFEYWGTRYSWKRTVKKEGHFQEMSYHLMNDKGAVLAHIVPVPLTTVQAQDERAKGGWVPPCSMWLSDPTDLSNDVADVILASGLIALVDDSIKSCFHNKRSMRLLLPLPSSKPGVEHIGPKRLIDEVFHRRHSHSHSHSHSAAVKQAQKHHARRSAA